MVASRASDRRSALFQRAQMLKPLGLQSKPAQRPFAAIGGGWRVQAIRRSCSISRPAALGQISH
jgi:hypothetical protein